MCMLGLSKSPLVRLYGHTGHLSTSDRMKLMRVTAAVASNINGLVSSVGNEILPCFRENRVKGGGPPLSLSRQGATNGGWFVSKAD